MIYSFREIPHINLILWHDSDSNPQYNTLQFYNTSSIITTVVLCAVHRCSLGLRIHQNISILGLGMCYHMMTTAFSFLQVSTKPSRTSRDEWKGVGSLSFSKDYLDCVVWNTFCIKTWCFTCSRPVRVRGETGEPTLKNNSEWSHQRSNFSVILKNKKKLKSQTIWSRPILLILTLCNFCIWHLFTLSLQLINHRTSLQQHGPQTVWVATP